MSGVELKWILSFIFSIWVSKMMQAHRYFSKFKEWMGMDGERNQWIFWMGVLRFCILSTRILRVLEGEKQFFYESTFDWLEFETLKKNKKINPIAWISPVSYVHITEDCTLETYFTTKYVEITNITMFKRQMRPCVFRTAFYCKCYCSVQTTQGFIF